VVSLGVLPNGSILSFTILTCATSLPLDCTKPGLGYREGSNAADDASLDAAENSFILLSRDKKVSACRKILLKFNLTH
jgi:hypothetical protein